MVPLLLAFGGVALAALAGAAGASDRNATLSALSALSAEPTSSALTERTVSQARHSLERADDARAAGDPEHAARLEALAREWASTGTDLVRAAAVESSAAAAQREAADLEAKTRRARALLEQTIARRGRAEARLQALTSPPASAAATGSAVPGGAP